MSILLGNGSGGFSFATNVAAGTGPQAVATGNFNSDTNPDLAVANFTSNNVTILLGNGVGGFVTAAGSPYTVGSQPYGVTVGDLNADSSPDLAVANSGTTTVSVLIGNGAGGFAKGEGLSGQDAAERVAELAGAEGLSNEDMEAIGCLGEVGVAEDSGSVDDGDIV